MFKRIDNWLSELTVFVSPLFNLSEPLLAKIKPFQEKLVSRFFKIFKKYLKISPEDKERVVNGNIVKIFRFYAVLAIVFRILFSVIATGGSQMLVWSTLIVNLPLAYLVCKGYRVAYLLLLCTNTGFSVLLLISQPLSILFVGVWWFIVCSVYFFGFKYENARIEMALNGEGKPLFYHHRKDVVTIIVIVALTSLFAELVSYVSQPRVPARHTSLISNYQLGRKAGIIVRNIYGYAEYCRSQGYELKIYPKVFADRYADEILQVQKELEERDSGLLDYYNNIKRVYGRKLKASIAGELDIMRRQIAIEMVADSRNIRPSQVKWNPEMENYVSILETCFLFDKISEESSQIAGRKLIDENSAENPEEAAPEISGQD